jgi:Mg-chelatase subunit ChlD/Mg-chelatase subunit ChlI
MSNDAIDREDGGEGIDNGGAEAAAGVSRGLGKEETIKSILNDMAKSRTRKIITSSVKTGRRADVITSGRRGRYVRARVPQDKAQDIALGPTIRAAIMRTGMEGGFKRKKKGRALEIKKQDFREKVRRIKISTLICLVFDASSSMVREEKLAAANAVIDALLLDAYQKRDRISIVTYQGQGADVVLPFTSSIELAKPYIADMQFGGTTPLASGILMGLQNIESKIRLEPEAIPIMVLITDGTANTTINPGEDLHRELVEICSLAMESDINMLVVDVSKDMSELAKEVADLCGGRYYYSGMLGRSTEFIDLVDQDIIINAFELTTINPSLGGVLVKGAGTKTVDAVAKGFTEILPQVEVVYGCPVSCSPKEPHKFCWMCREQESPSRSLRPARVIRIDPDTTLEELTGYLDLENVWDVDELKEGGEALSKAVKPGLFAEANQGVLFVEDADSLDEDVIEAISQVVITGLNTIRAEDFTVSHHTRFILAGTVDDPKAVHPLISDQFGMLVDLGAMDEVSRRILHLKQRKEFDTDSKKFKEQLKTKHKTMRTEIIRSQAMLPEVVTSDDHLDLIARISIDAGIVGHVCDILIERVARTLAAVKGRTRTEEEDIIRAAEMVVPLRQTEERFENLDVTDEITEVVREYE